MAELQEFTSNVDVCVTQGVPVSDLHAHCSDSQNNVCARTDDVVASIERLSKFIPLNKTREESCLLEPLIIKK